MKRKTANLDFYVRLGSRIREAREADGLSQKALADGVGVSYQQISKYENGTDRIPVDRLIRAANFLRTPIMELLS